MTDYVVPREEDHDRSDEDEDGERLNFAVNSRETELRHIQDTILAAEEGTNPPVVKTHLFKPVIYYAIWLLFNSFSLTNYIFFCSQYLFFPILI